MGHPLVADFAYHAAIASTCAHESKRLISEQLDAPHEIIAALFFECNAQNWYYLSYADRKGLLDSFIELAMVDVYQVAEKFGARVKSALSDSEFESVITRNASPEYAETGACATYDYIDASEAMAAAFVEVFGHDPHDTESGTPSPKDSLIWSQAWAVARASEFGGRA